MSRLTDHLRKRETFEGTDADPLPGLEGDSSETDRWDDSDTPPGVDADGTDHRSPEARKAWERLLTQHGGEPPFPEIAAWTERWIP